MLGWNRELNPIESFYFPPFFREGKKRRKRRVDIFFFVKKRIFYFFLEYDWKFFFILFFYKYSLILLFFLFSSCNASCFLLFFLSKKSSDLFLCQINFFSYSFFYERLRFINRFILIFFLWINLTITIMFVIIFKHYSWNTSAILAMWKVWKCFFSIVSSVSVKKGKKYQHKDAGTYQ